MTTLRAVVLGCAGVLAAGCGRPEPPGDAGADEDGSVAPPVALRFEEGPALPVPAHVTGGYGAKLLPETMGSGAALFDHDGDGVLDLFLVGSSHLPTTPADAPRGRGALLRGRGDGSFEDVSAATGADLEVYGMGCAAADHDGDGDVDVYVTTLFDDLLLRADGGTFVDVAAAAGVGRGRWRDADGTARPEWTTACLWLDADVDGHLDLFVGGYCQWTPELEVFTSLDGVEKAFTTPERYRGLPCRLYRNTGDGTFVELPLGEGGADDAKALGAATWDLDLDGLPEVLVANDTRPDFLLHNLGGGRFREVGATAGLAYDETGRARAGMGVDVAEDARGAMVAIGNFAGEPLSLHRSEGDLRFRADAARAGLAVATRLPLTFGLAFLDLDLDGHQDLVLANGHIEPDVARFRPGHAYAQPHQAFLGSADGRFVDVSAALGADFARPRVARALVGGDLDGDGDVDLVVTQNGGHPVVLLNRQQERAPRHWLRVVLADRDGTPQGLGARVTLRAGAHTQVRTVRTGGSYLGHGDVGVTFGLGAADAVERLEVRWPGGAHRAYAPGGVDRTVLLTPSGGAAAGG